MTSAVTSKTTLAALVSELFGLPIASKTVFESNPFIWITTEEDVAVKFAGVATVSVWPESRDVLVAAEATVTVVVVADDGVAPPAQPIVVKTFAVEVA